MTLAEAHQAHQDAVQHGREGRGSVPSPPTAPSGSCARCGAPASPRPRARFCSPSCQQADVRARRAQARVDLLNALAGLQAAVARVEAALQVMGFRPSHPRRPRIER